MGVAVIIQQPLKLKKDMILGYKIRIYPTPTQEELLWKHINSARFIWNYMLNLQETLYHNNQKHLDRFQMCKVISNIKKQDEYSWLNEVSNATLQKICTDLDFAYKRFYNKISKQGLLSVNLI